jgi:hypothetical protein
LISKQNDDDACVWYLVNILLDTTIGVIINWVFVRLIDFFARRNKIEALVSGNYYSRDSLNFEDYNINYNIWFIQASLWCFICFLMKIAIYFILLHWNRILNNFGKYLLRNFAFYPKIELMFVMVIIPLIMNSIQVID